MLKLFSQRNRQFIKVGYDMVSKFNSKCNVRHYQNPMRQVHISHPVFDCHSGCSVYKSLRIREDEKPQRWRGKYGSKPMYEHESVSESESYFSDEGYETEDGRRNRPKSVNEIVDKVLVRAKDYINKTGKWQLKIPEYKKNDSSGKLYISSAIIKDFRSVKKLGSFKKGYRRDHFDEFSGTVELPALTVHIPKYRFTIWGTPINGSMECKITKCQIKLNVTALECPKTDFDYRVIAAKSSVKFQNITVNATGLTILFNWILSVYLTKIVKDYSYTRFISNHIEKATNSTIHKIGK